MERLRSEQLQNKNQRNRGDAIRTRDLLVPNQALYQAEPHPVVI